MNEEKTAIYDEIEGNPAMIIEFTDDATIDACLALGSISTVGPMNNVLLI